MKKFRQFCKKILLAPLWCFMGDTSWIGALVGADASESATKASKETANVNLMFQMMQWNKQRENMKPWLMAGQSAVNRLAEGMKDGGQFSTTPQFDPSKYAFDSSKVDVTKDPGYKFRMAQGQNALTAGSAAAGNYGSGNLGVALQNYGQDLGSQEYAAAYNRALGENQTTYGRAIDAYNAAMTSQNTVFNRLAGLSGTGQVAATTLGTAGQNYANQVGSITTNATNQQNQYALNQSGMFQNAMANTGASAGQFANYLGNYFSQQNALTNSLYGGSGGGYGLGQGGGYDLGMGTGQGADFLFGGGS